MVHSILGHDMEWAKCLGYCSVMESVGIRADSSSLGSIGVFLIPQTTRVSNVESVSRQSLKCSAVLSKLPTQ